MLTLTDLVARGYFPGELPPPFTTESLATALAFNYSALPGSFTNDAKPTKACNHNLARPGTLRRPLAIPNPVTFFNLCDVLIKNWTAVESHVHKSPLSRSIPTDGPWDGRALVQSTNLKELPTHKAWVRAAGKYLLIADISRFYHSIYTHSISWALHTKAFAKANRNAPILGNLLDKWSRNAQDGQTVGIPIGPDTSYVIAEIVLSACDVDLSRDLSTLRGFRYIDDYELSFDDRAQAEAALAMLQETLARYELALNPTKTRIIELPVPLAHPWASELGAFNFRLTSKDQRRDLIQYFDRAFILFKEFPGEPVLRYAIARIRGVKIQPDNWKFVQQVLCQCVLVEPGTLVYTVQHLLHYQLLRYPIELELLEEVMNRQISYHAPRGHGSEVAWAVWTLMCFGQKIDSNAGSLLAKMEDSVVALLALDADTQGLVTGGLDTSTWRPYMTTQELYGPYWLLSYEANVKGWIPSAGISDHVSADQNFAFLKQAGVSFYYRRRPLGAYPMTAFLYP